MVDHGIGIGGIVGEGAAGNTGADRDRGAAFFAYLAPDLEHIAELGRLVENQLGYFGGHDPAGVHLAAGIDRGAFINPGRQFASEDRACGVEVLIHYDAAVGS